MNRKDIKWKFIGTFENKSGLMDITDPCYDKDVWCRTRRRCAAGKYNAYIDVRTLKDWGTRVYGLRIVHKDYDKPENLGRMNPFLWRPKAIKGVVGVDAGLCGFFDEKPDFEDDDFDKPGKYNKLNPKTWSQMCDLVRDQNYAVLSYGVFSSSGIGDGVYPCYYWLGAGNHEKWGESVAFELRFL